ncbi:hypothetical protein HYH03_017962 [Edaphochlamys debaryana]|uniref:Uncharacterized protein n=1 Tax=Edaphochlamys debaryana TaxID=47281 RepID=A0A835XLE4_9CHLO|nr:hypothetical protein HYH03_017962 [Edaphochlamys debaryana]|eukprot:KAG2483170.1 hypothetical protein HYH03_017962 [Edaphochlamys debaryana]
MAPPSDPVADVWRSPELLGYVALFLDPSHAAWSFVRVNKAAAAATYGVRLSWALSSGLLATHEGRLHARSWCYRLTYKQRVKLLCRAAAADCSRESLEGAVVAAGLSPPPLKVLVAAASAGRLGVCRWLVEGLGCPGLHRLACLSLISAAGPGPGVVEEARAWLAPADLLLGWSAEQEAQAARGGVEAVADLLRNWQPGDVPQDHIRRWRKALDSVKARRDLEQPNIDVLTLARLAGFHSGFYRGPHAALAVARLAQLEPAAYYASTLIIAAKAGHVEAVRYLLSRGVRPHADWPDLPAFAASRNGHVGVLQALHEAGCMGDPAACFQAGLWGGSLPVVEWLVGTFGAPALRVDEVCLSCAARSGSVPLLRALPGLLGLAAPGWDRCRDVYWENAAESGCEEAVEWLAKEAGVPVESRQDTYRGAASQGDLRMVQRLRRLGCPYSARDAEALAEAARRVPASAAALPWLEEPGCPVSWGAAAAEAEAEARAEAEAQARANAEAKAVTLLNHVVYWTAVLLEGPRMQAKMTGGVNPCGPGHQTWGFVRYCLLVVFLPVAVTVSWLYVKGQPLRKRAFWVPIAFALTHMVVALIGLFESVIRLALVLGYHFGVWAMGEAVQMAIDREG